MQIDPLSMGILSLLVLAGCSAATAPNDHPTPATMSTSSGSTPSVVVVMGAPVARPLPPAGAPAAPKRRPVVVARPGPKKCTNPKVIAVVINNSPVVFPYCDEELHQDGGVPEGDGAAP